MNSLHWCLWLSCDKSIGSTNAWICEFAFYRYNNIRLNKLERKRNILLLLHLFSQSKTKTWLGFVAVCRLSVRYFSFFNGHVYEIRLRRNWASKILFGWLFITFQKINYAVECEHEHKKKKYWMKGTPVVDCLCKFYRVTVFLRANKTLLIV